ncbi:MFS transporter [Hymenobacter sp. RP-2-7]|uniref:MFS transporter n=1 Tax=Hymenobacter polaris TaxID=2682546 RepID=A0A7Y0AEK8_9BACT|nr:MFS transporter [Hymenobacter polaris]NML65872.1 MFS transporter [Hymenobacter polaris]
MNPSPPAPHDPYAALRLPDFRRYITARVLFNVATQIQGVVVSWQIFKLTNDPLALGLVGLAEAIPSITVSLYAGHVADSVRRKRIIVPAVLVLFLCAVTLFWLSHQMALLNQGRVHLSVFNATIVWPLYLAIFVSGVARGFLGPALFSFMPQLLPERELLANAVTWSSTSWQASAVVGPAVGGLLLHQGISFAYGVDVTLEGLALLLFSSIASRALPPIEGERLKLGESILSGIKFIFANQIVLAALSLDMFAVLFGGAVALLPFFAENILKAGPDAFGYLRAAPAVGSVIMAVWLTFSPLKSGAGRKLLWAVAGFGLATIAFALSRNLYLSLFLLFLTGVFDSVSVIVRSTLVHTYTPEYMKGRVSAVNNIFIGSSNEIGGFESGAAAKLMGTVPSVVFGGIMTVLIVAFTAWRADQLRRLDMGAGKK